MICSIRIGTSGWYYKHWLGKFYPAQLPMNQMFEFYTRHFNTVEINNSFYALPKEETVRKWRRDAPIDFCFAAKASRFLTHIKRLKDCEEALARYLNVMANLEEKLGPILFQFPQKWGLNLQRLASFLSVLPETHRYVFEFRNSEWHIPSVYKLLRDFHAALCFYDMGGAESPMELTSDFVYVRLHSPDVQYEGNYVTEKLIPWAERIEHWSGQVKHIYLYFNNDAHGHAVSNALELKRMLQTVTAT